jgi:hypothetical protein
LDGTARACAFEGKGLISSYLKITQTDGIGSIGQENPLAGVGVVEAHEKVQTLLTELPRQEQPVPI